MSIQPSDSVGKAQKISHFEAVFRELASGCAKLTLNLNQICLTPLKDL